MSARITRAADAPTYSPPQHSGVSAKRLQGHEAGPTHAFWVGNSLYQPGGSAGPSSTRQESVYVVLAGEVVLVLEDDGVERSEVLRDGDSVHLPAGTVRTVVNASNRDAEVLVIIAMPADEPDS